jgi:hypothetical protein
MKNLLAGAIALVLLSSCQNQAEQEILGASPINSIAETNVINNVMAYRAVDKPEAILVKNVVFEYPRPVFLSRYPAKTFNNEWALQADHFSEASNALYLTDQTKAYVYVIKNNNSITQQQLNSGALNQQILSSKNIIESISSSINTEDFMLSNSKHGFLIVPKSAVIKKEDFTVGSLKISKYTLPFVVDSEMFAYVGGCYSKANNNNVPLMYKGEGSAPVITSLSSSRASIVAIKNGKDMGYILDATPSNGQIDFVNYQIKNSATTYRISLVVSAQKNCNETNTNKMLFSTNDDSLVGKPKPSEIGIGG